VSCQLVAEIWKDLKKMHGMEKSSDSDLPSSASADDDSQPSDGSQPCPPLLSC